MKVVISGPKLNVSDVIIKKKERVSRRVDDLLDAERNIKLFAVKYHKRIPYRPNEDEIMQELPRNHWLRTGSAGKSAN
jgi:hypothetical protein